LFQPESGAGGGLDFGAVERLQRQAHAAGAQGQLHGLFEEGAPGFFVSVPEAPERIVIGLEQAAQPGQRQDFGTGGFEFAAGADAEVVAVEPDFEQQTGRIGRAAVIAGGHGEVERGQIELIDELAQEAHGMIGAHPVFEGRGKQELLSVIGSD
jgi:hypothetical protein